MKNIKLLDCTLRDGGRLIDCKFNDYSIKEICRRLSNSNIDIIEVGFLRDTKLVKYNGNNTFFTDVKQISCFLPKKSDSTYVAFIDYGMFDFNTLPICDGSSITGLRIGFTKKDFANHKEDLIRVLKEVKEKKYQLFIQGVNSLGYTDEGLCDVISMVNEIEPYSFGIVDTYGAMFPEDVQRIFNLVNSKLKKSIALDFHAHNNRQLAFSNALLCIDLCNDDRVLIIDSTLEGMGKCAGNLNTELIVDYLVEKRHYNYDFDEILDSIDEFIRPIKQDKSWGYTVPALMGGLYKSHPNNIIYLFNKFRLSCKDFKNIISMIDEDLRQRYDYDNIERLYNEYNSTKYDDSKSIALLNEKLSGKKILIKAPGRTLKTHAFEIEQYIYDNNPIVITVSFDEENSICFCGNKRRYDKLLVKNTGEYILTSNICLEHDGATIVDYNALVDRRYPLYDNSVMMLLNLLKKIRVSEIAIAGFDGYNPYDSNYIDPSFYNDRQENCEYLNTNIAKMLSDYIKSVEPEISVSLITPSKYVGEYE